MADGAPAAPRQLRENGESVPSPARVWDYWLGGRAHDEADRAAGDRYRETYPEIVRAVRASRHFLIRGVRCLVSEHGVRQFLDAGSGLPTVDSTHQVAQRAAPECRVVYADNDPAVLRHADGFRAGSPEGATDVVPADVRDPEALLHAAGRTLDLSRPVAVVLGGVLGHVTDGSEARGIVSRLLEPLPSGSFLCLSDGTVGPAGGAYEEAQRRHEDAGAVPYTLRTPEEVAGFFTGLELLAPGVVPCAQWRAEVSPFGDGQPVDAYGGIGGKP